jgi:hypothetical protein
LAVAIKSIYVDNTFLFDASNAAINPKGNLVNPNSTKTLSFQGLPTQNKLYQPTSIITVVTDRGTRSLGIEQNLAAYNDTIPNYQTNFGPIRLDFKKFYYATYNGQLSAWQPGWNISKGESYVAWNVTVTNIGSTTITLKNSTCFFLMAVSPANVREWYLNTTLLTLNPNQTKDMVFIWNSPNPAQFSTNNVNKIFNTACTCRVFMAFFGNYQSGTPLAQTIPFQSVNVV